MNRRRQCGKQSPRRGYALLLVIVFLVLFLAMLGTAWRQVASVLRVESVRYTQTRRDQGCLQAAIQGVHYLEETATPDPSRVFTIPGFTNTFTVTFTHDDLMKPTEWTVKAVPTPP